jgi:acyl transferase domain-containing protein
MSLPGGNEAMEPIAIVGMAMRFPGGSHSSEQFWDMLAKGRSAHKKIPKVMSATHR